MSATWPEREEDLATLDERALVRALDDAHRESDNAEREHQNHEAEARKWADAHRDALRRIDLISLAYIRRRTDRV